MSKLKQAIALNVEHKERHRELYALMCSAKDDNGKTDYSCQIMSESTKHHQALRALGYRHRDLDMDGPGPIRNTHTTGPESRHWLIRITKAWIAHRKRRRLLRDAAHGLQTNFMVVKDWKKLFPRSQEFKHFSGTMEENWEKADRIQGFLSMRVNDFEREWKRLGLSRDISNIYKIWS